jgi:hypothetical protein
VTFFDIQAVVDLLGRFGTEGKGNFGSGRPGLDIGTEALDSAYPWQN